MRRCRWAICFLAVCFTVLVFPMNAKADTGPKPSVTVTVNGVEEGVLYYATLLSEDRSTGPATAYDGEYSRYSPGEAGYEIWKKFVEYQDSDGYYFLQEYWTCNGSDEFCWGYYPPSPFKILLYFPESDSFVVSGIYERYAFDSYYTVDVSEIGVTDVAATDKTTDNAEAAGNGGNLLTAEKSYDYSWEIVSLIARIVITILVELLVALLFGLRGKKQLQLLVAINVVTQVVLNVLLNLVNYNKGQYAFVFYYVLWELLVFGMEAVIYSMVLKKTEFGAVAKGKAVLYAFVANGASFGIGMWIANLIPGIF